MAPPGFPPGAGGPLPLQPAKLADYKLAEALGAGATASVYDAVHLPSGRAVAIKILDPASSGSEVRERFAREALLLAGVASRHVGAIEGFGFERGQPFLVLERLHGETLDAKLRRDGPVALPIAVRWIEQLLVGVRDCHDEKIIHRDIKPSNIFLHTEGFEETVKLIDFGVARLRDITGTAVGLTSTNQLIGSMGYMAPEQLQNPKAVDFTADLYAVGVVIFRTMTGRLPFVSRSLETVMKMKAEHAAPPVSSMPEMPANELLDGFVAKAMSRRPADRFQTAREMLESWWRVMASLDEDGATDVMKGIGRVDESYAGPLRRTARDLEISGMQRSSGAVQDLEEERTLRRLAYPPATTTPWPSGTTQPRPAPSSPDANAPERETTLLDLGPTTRPAVHLAPDEYDLPTRSDPNLRRLVEQELELHRKGKPPRR